MLSGSSLAALAAASSLNLRSYSSIDFYGNATIGTRGADGSFGLGKLEFDAASLNAATGAQVTIAAGEVLFTNGSGATASGLGGSGGTLVVNAETITLGTGAKSVDGFGRVALEADKAILGRGAGTIDFGSADLAFAAPLLSAESGAAQELDDDRRVPVDGHIFCCGRGHARRKALHYGCLDRTGRPDRSRGRLAQPARDQRRCRADKRVRDARRGRGPEFLLTRA